MAVSGFNVRLAEPHDPMAILLDGATNHGINLLLPQDTVLCGSALPISQKLSSKKSLCYSECFDLELLWAEQE